jgi:hypothetical protein
VVSAAVPLWSLISVFWTGAATFLSSSSSFILTRAEWAPFQIHCYTENLIAPGIEPGTSVLAVWNSDHLTTEGCRQARQRVLNDIRDWQQDLVELWVHFLQDVCRVTNDTTRVRIGYRIYLLWRFTAPYKLQLQLIL